MDAGTKNVLVFSLGMMFAFSSYYGITNCQKIILDSFKAYKIDGFLGLALSYGGFAFGALFSPVANYCFTTKQNLVTGLTLLSILGLPLIYPYPLAVYSLDFISGIGVGLIGTACGWVISCCSTIENLNSNLGIVFFFYMLGPTCGNFFIFLSFSGKTEISDNVRYITVLILSAIGFLGPLMMVFFNQSALEDNSGEKHDAEESKPLTQSEKKENMEKNRSVKDILQTFPQTVKHEDKSGERQGTEESKPLIQSEKNENTEKNRSVKDALQTIPQTLKLAVTNRTLVCMLCVMLFSGMEMALWSGVLGTCVGNYTYQSKAKPLMGLCGVFVGAGEIAASLMRTLLPRFLKHSQIRPFTIISATIGFNVAYLLMHLYLPSETLQHEVPTKATFIHNYVICVVFAGFLLGFSDCFLQSEILASFSVWFPDVRSNYAACSVYLVLQALGGSLMFALSTSCNLNTILTVAAVTNLVATIGTLIAHFRTQSKLSLSDFNSNQ